MISVLLTNKNQLISGLKGCILFGLLFSAWTTFGQQQPIVDPQIKKTEVFDKFFWEAQKYKITNRLPQAFKAFLQCDSVQEGKAVVLTELSVISLKMQRQALAMEFAEKALKAKDVNSTQMEQVAYVYAELGLYQDAADIFEDINKEEPEKLNPLFQLVALYIELTDYESAITALDRMEALQGVSPEVSTQKKQIYLELGKLDEALEEVDALIKTYPGNFNYQLEKAEMLAVNGKTKEARDIWIDIIEQYAVQPIANLRLARYYQDEGEYDKSYEYLKVAMASEELDIDDKIAVLLNMYVHSEGDSALTAKAFELAELTVQAAPRNPKAWSVKGDFHLREDQKAEAYSCFKTAVELPSGDKFEIWQQILVLDAQLEQWDELKKDAQEASDLFPSQPFPPMMKGLAHLQVSEYEQAVESLESSLDVAFGNKPMQEQLYSYLGQAFHELEKHDESDEAFRKALKINPQNALNLNNLAYYLSLRKKDLAEALKMTEKSNLLSPENSTYLDTWAWVLFQSGQYAEALTKQKKALALEENPASELVEHHGDILFKLDRVDEAVAEWQKAQSLKGANLDRLKKKIESREYHE